MKKILFHTYQLNYGGACNALIEYARYNRKMLGNESVLLYDPNLFVGVPDFQSEPAVIDALKKEFRVETYSSEIEANRIAEEFDAVYTIRGGAVQDPIITSSRMAVHAVFQYHLAYGDRFAYVSDWLANKMANISGTPMASVPHMIHMPEPNEAARLHIRRQLGIPDHAFVFGRHGGQGSFDLPFVYSAIHNIIHQRSDVYFVFLNTRPFYHHPNIKYLPATYNPQNKSDFISTCDAMIHARSNGESFGIAICEFMFHHKPVLSWEGGSDQHHVQLLNGYDSLYNEHNAEQRLLEFVERKHVSYKPIVDKFAPEPVMNQFKQVFLD